MAVRCSRSIILILRTQWFCGCRTGKPLLVPKSLWKASKTNPTSAPVTTVALTQLRKSTQLAVGTLCRPCATLVLSDTSMDSMVDIMTTHGYGQLQNLSQPCTVWQQYNKPYWQTEVMEDKGGYDGSITNGQKWSTSIYQSLNQGGFSAWFYWWAMNYTSDDQGLVNYSNTNWTYQIPKRLYTIGQFGRFMRPGSVLLTSTSSSSSLESTAAKPTSGTIALVLSNTSTASISVTVTLSNLSTPPGSITPFRTSSTENQVQLSPIPVSNGTFTITIPASSVVT